MEELVEHYTRNQGGLKCKLNDKTQVTGKDCYLTTYDHLFWNIEVMTLKKKSLKREKFLEKYDFQKTSDFNHFCKESSLTLGKKLGAGSFGAVYRASFTKSPNFGVAVKFLTAGSINDQKEFDREMSLLKGLAHKNVILLMG